MRCGACRRRTSRRRRRSRPAAISLAPTIAEMTKLRAIVALGRIAHETFVAAQRRAPLSDYPFAHGGDARDRRAHVVRQLSLLALQHQYRRADAGDVPRRCSRRCGKSFWTPDRPGLPYAKIEASYLPCPFRCAGKCRAARSTRTIPRRSLSSTARTPAARPGPSAAYPSDRGSAPGIPSCSSA